MTLSSICVALNILLVDNYLKLTDLDAACNMAKGDCAGEKYSSGYLAPELLWRDSDSTVRVRARDGGLNAAPGQYELLPAHPSQDMWALGCVLYTLCCGSTLF
jgi:serine/threonine protein kinase